MGICPIYILVVAIFQVVSTPKPGTLQAFLHIQSSPQEYGDSPRASSVSRLHMTESVSAKFLLKKVEPEFPYAARAVGVEGEVVFRIVIGRSGRVKEIHLRRGKPLLIEAAAKAVSEWEYETYVLNGNAVEVETFATVRFRLSSKHR